MTIKKWKDVIFDRTYFETLPKALIVCIKRAKRLMLYFAGIMVIGSVVAAKSFSQFITYVGLCLLIEWILFLRFIRLKSDLVNTNYDVYIGIVIGSDSPWWIGGKLNQKREKQILLIEREGDRQLIKCSLSGNISANLDDGSRIKIYAKETTEDDAGILIVISYYAIVNQREEEEIREDIK